MKNKRVLVLGANGMLGNAIFTELSKFGFDVFGTVRGADEGVFFQDYKNKIKTGIDIERFDTLSKCIKEIKPDILINCIGLIKQVPSVSNVALAIFINALFPHKLAGICKELGVRMIHFSTDCVFSGKGGNYKEFDFADADDVYGRTKYLGEVSYDHCITLRTSIIGHGVEPNASLIDWFLSQDTESVNGYNKVIYSGFPTVEIARILKDHVIPNPELSGLFHVSSDPISKFDLLELVAKIYGKKIKLVPSEVEISDKSLNSEIFRHQTGYVPPCWEDLIKEMYSYYKSNSNFIKY